MIKVLNGKKLENFEINKEYYTVGDIGCGDGKFIYNLAKKSPDKFFIGLDSSTKLLEKTSLKIKKKESKGGLNNIIYSIYNIYNIPSDFDKVFNEVYINFPWGDLLKGIVTLDERFIKSLSKIVKSKATIRITLTYGSKFEENYIKSLNLPELSEENVQKIINHFEENSFKLVIKEILGSKDSMVDTSWGKKLLSSRNRVVFYLEFKYD